MPPAPAVRQAQGLTREAELRQRQVQQIDVLVEKIHRIRQGIDEQVAQLLEASSELRTVCRRNYDEASSSYLVFANSHLRLAGALSQGIRRTGSMDRFLQKAAHEREEAKLLEEKLRQQREAREQARMQAEAVQQLQLPTEDDFDELYGEILNDASE